MSSRMTIEIIADKTSRAASRADIHLHQEVCYLHINATFAIRKTNSSYNFCTIISLYFYFFIFATKFFVFEPKFERIFKCRPKICKLTQLTQLNIKSWIDKNWKSFVTINIDLINISFSQINNKICYTRIEY